MMIKVGYIYIERERGNQAVYVPSDSPSHDERRELAVITRARKKHRAVFFFLWKIAMS